MATHPRPNQFEPEPLFLTRRAAARMIIPPVSISTITRWQRNGQLPRHGTRGLALVRRDELDQFLSRKAGGAVK